MTEIKINSKPEGEDGILVATAFKFGEDTTPEQSFRELLDAVVAFSRLNADAAQKTGLEISALDVLDKFIDCLEFEKKKLYWAQMLTENQEEDAHD